MKVLWNPGVSQIIILISKFSTISTTINQTMDSINEGTKSVEEGLKEIDKNLRSLK